MLQIFPELIWTTWQTIGMLFGFLIVFYYLITEKLQILFSTFVGDEIPVRYAVVLALFLGSPLLLGELTAVVALSFLYPDWFHYLMMRGARFYLTGLEALALVALVVHVSNRRKRNAREVPKNPSPYYNC